MEIKKGINPNCSELVVRLPPWDNVAELRSLFRELEEITGWKAGCSEHFIKVDEGSFDVNTPVPIERIKAGKVKDMENCPFVKLGDIPELDQSKETSERIAEKLKYGVNGIGKLLANGFWGRIQEKPLSQRKEPVGLVPHGEVMVEKVSKGSPSSLPSEVRIRASDGYEDHPALMAWQHGYKPHFKPLAKAARTLESSWHTHDGGGPEPFREWCRANGFEDIAKELL